jgi:Ni/Fe-hydrogenase subunit HybB-like protein
VAVLKFLEGREILKNNFSWAGEVEALLQTFDCGLACGGL